MFPLILLLLIIPWVWIGVQGTCRARRYFKHRYGPVLGYEAWTRSDENMGRVLALLGPINWFAVWITFDNVKEV